MSDEAIKGALPLSGLVGGDVGEATEPRIDAVGDKGFLRLIAPAVLAFSSPVATLESVTEVALSTSGLGGDGMDEAIGS